MVSDILQQRVIRTRPDLEKAAKADSTAIDHLFDIYHGTCTDERQQTMDGGVDPDRQGEDVGWSQSTLPEQLKTLGVQEIRYYAYHARYTTFPNMGHEYSIEARAVDAQHCTVMSFVERMRDGKVSQIFNVHGDHNKLQEQQWTEFDLPADEKWRKVGDPRGQVTYAAGRNTINPALPRALGGDLNEAERNLPFDIERFTPEGIAFLNTVMSPDGTGLTAWNR